MQSSKCGHIDLVVETFGNPLDPAGTRGESQGVRRGDSGDRERVIRPEYLCFLAKAGGETGKLRFPVQQFECDYREERPLARQTGANANDYQNVHGKGNSGLIK